MGVFGRLCGGWFQTGLGGGFLTVRRIGLERPLGGAGEATGALNRSGRWLGRDGRSNHPYGARLLLVSPTRFGDAVEHVE